MKEFDFIKSIQTLFPQPAHGPIGNDCHPFLLSDNKTGLISKDMLVEGVHFYPEIPLKALAYKALTVNLTDILADGGTPLFFMIGIGVPPQKKDCLLELYNFFKEFLTPFNIPIVGGDTVSSSVFFLSLTCVGQTTSPPWLRKNAKPHDYIYVTGELGGSSAGLKLLLKKGHNTKNPLIKRHLFPPYRKGLETILKDKIHAAIDISDSFLADLAKILEESALGACLEKDKIPIQKKASLDDALWGGEDYEILFTSPYKLDKKELLKQLGFSVSCVGKITPSLGQVILKSKEKKVSFETKDLIQRGFNHWKQ